MLQGTHAIKLDVRRWARRVRPVAEVEERVHVLEERVTEDEVCAGGIGDVCALEGVNADRLIRAV